MHCPVCDNPLLVLEFDKIEVDFCAACHGVWLDAGELEQLLKDTEQMNHLMTSFKEAVVDERKYPCPICRQKMKKVWVGMKQEVLIDECKNNHGLWFDKGELKEVVQLGSLAGNSYVIHLLNEMFESELLNQQK